LSQNHDTTNTNQEKQPLPGRVAIYTRGVTAAAQTPTPHVQTSDLLALVLELGYCTEQVMLFEEGHVSGKTASLRRVALSELLHKMTQPQPGREPIKAVFIANESRLQAGRRAAARRRRQGEQQPDTSLDVWTYAETHDNETTAQ